MSSSTVAVAALAALTGCNAFEGLVSTDKVDYHHGAKQTVGLDVPPDLTQLPRNINSPAPGSTVSAAALQTQGAAAPQTVTPGDQVAMANVADLHLDRQGDLRWLHSSQTPEKLWPQVHDFWIDAGFEIDKEDAKVGTMETNWLENRAKLPDNFITKTLGGLLSDVFSTGQRDRYRIRMERDPKGGTNIYVSQMGMEEVYTSTDHDNLAWVNRPNDPTLEAIMLSRLMLKLGGVEAPKAEVAALAASASASSAAPALSGTGAALAAVPTSITISDGFDIAWRRVGQSLDRHGFTIEDRDRSQGLFFLRYADPDKVGKEEPNFFAKLFGAKDETSAKVRISVKTTGEHSVIIVENDKGVQQTDEIAKRIIKLLQEDLR